MIAACRIPMEEQLLRKAPYLSRNYHYPPYLIVVEISPEIGSCERVEPVLLEKLVLHLIFHRLHCHSYSFFPIQEQIDLPQLPT
jgi:hypothetical protein